jgi:hypothetical protein
LGEEDPILALQVETVGQGDKLQRKEDFQDLLDRGQTTLKVPKTPITGYANKNPEEAFCEAVGLLVTYGPRAVHEKIRHWLDVVLPGQVKLAQRVVRRYLEARHSRSKCMQCSAKPTVAYHWADGRAMAWFCDKHAEKWKSEAERDIVKTVKIKDGLAPDKISHYLQAVLKQKHRDDTDREEWALFDSEGKKVLKWFGSEKPSKERVLKEERRIQHFKNL